MEKSKNIKKEDVVNNPSHYIGKHECIDVMEQQFGIESVRTFCKLNAFKYIFRSEKKENEVEDIKKADWYLKKWLSYEK